MAVFGRKNRKRRIVELILAVSVVALVIWILGPYRKQEDSERATRQAQAQAIVDGAASGLTSFAETFPTAFGEALRNQHVPFEERTYRVALKVANDNLEKSPDDIEQLLIRAHLHDKLEDFESSLDDLNRVIELDPEHFRALNNRAYLLARFGEFEEALTDARGADRLAPNQPHTLDTLAFVLVGLERDQEAVPLYRKVLELKSDSLHARWGLASALRRQGQTAEAQKLFDEVKAEDPTFCLHWEVENDPGHHPKRT